MAVVGLTRTRRPEGGRQSRPPWPILRPDDCAHLDLHELLVRADDGQFYKAAICALCGAVQDVQALRHRNGPPRGLLMSKAAGDSIDWRGNPLYRWITIHPHGEEGQGYPVLLRLDKKGSSSGRIVAGAGGSLNYRRISRLKTKRQYEVEARERRVQRKEEREAREAAMPEAEIAERAVARKEVAQARTEAKHEYLRTVAEVQGWGAVALSDEDKARMSEDSVRRIEAERERWQERAARKLDENIKDLVIEQHDREIAESLDGMNPEALMSDEVDDSGLGYAATFAALAEAHGMAPDEARLRAGFATGDAFVAAEEAGYIESAENAQRYVDMLQEGAATARTEDRPFREEGLHRPEFSAEVSDPAQARRLLVAREQWKQRERELKAKERGIEGLAPGSIEIPAGAALVETTELSDEEAMKRVTMGLQDRARLVAADELISEVEALEERTGSIEQHVHEGHSRQLEEIGQATFHQPVGMGRETVDVLGADASAAIFAELLKDEMNGDVEAVREALREHHIRTQAEKARDAVAEGKKHLDAAEEAVKDLPELGEDGTQVLLAIQAANDRRRKELEEGKRTMGVALGRLEMLGSINAAVGEEHERIDVALGELGGKQAYQIAAALGLEEGEYEVQSDGPHKYLLLQESGWRKLVEPPDPEQAELYEAAIGIKKGEADEEGWLPDGIMARPSDAYYDDVAIQRAYEWDTTPEFEGKSGEELEGTIRDYAGNMLANDGVGSMGSLRFRMLSPEFQADHLNDDQIGDYQRVMADLFPAEGADDDWESVAQELVAPIREREDPEHTALDSQRISVPQSYDAMHRALNEVPGGKVAFKPLAAFDSDDVGLLHDYFWDNLTEEKRPVAAETRERRLATMTEAEKVVAGQRTIFGEVEAVRRGETEAFRERAAEEEEAAAENAWTRYVKAQGSPQAAYHSLQDLVKGEMVEKFAGHYGRETGREIKAGRTDIANPLKHIIGLMPKETLERVLDADNAVLRKMYDGLRTRDAAGRYAPGEVSDLAQRILAKAKKMQLVLFAERPPSTQRLNIGKTAESQARRIWSQVAPTFDPDHPVEIPQDVSMSGDYAHQQRAVKMLERVKRFALNYSVGSGKSLIGISGFTHLAAQGKVKRGLFIVPPKIVAQFGGEMNRFVEPGKFRYFADPSANAEERHKMYADPNTQMVAVSHQAWRDDVTWAVAQSEFGGDTNEASHFLLTGPADERQEAVNKALEEQGWQFGYQCLPGRTLITLADGTQVPIEQLVHSSSGARVLSYNRHSGTLETKPIRAGWRRSGEGKSVLRISTRGYVLECTGDHLVLTTERGWVCAEALLVGEHLLTDGISTLYNGQAAHAQERGADHVRYAGRGDARRWGHDKTECWRQSTAPNPTLSKAGGICVPSGGTAAAIAKQGCAARSEWWVGRRPAGIDDTVLIPTGRTLSGQLSQRQAGGPCADRGMVESRSDGVLGDGRRQPERTMSDATSDEFIQTGRLQTAKGSITLARPHCYSPTSPKTCGPFLSAVQQGIGRTPVPPHPTVHPTVVGLQACGPSAVEAVPYMRQPYEKPARKRPRHAAVLRGMSSNMAQEISPTVVYRQPSQGLRGFKAAECGIAGRPGEKCRVQPQAARIEAIEEIESEEWVYDISVADNHNFFANGVLVHNCCDEAHDALNRKGKPNSRLANVTDATTSGAEYFITATATPVKNDASELYDLLCKVRPDKFKPEGWQQFHRRYALDTRASRDALQRLVMPYFYAKDVDTGVKRTKVQRPIALSDWQKVEYGKVLDAYQRARRAPEGSEESREALGELVGLTALEGIDEAARSRKLDDAGKALGFARDRAIGRVVMHAPTEHNPRIQDAVELAEGKRDADDDGGQVPGLVFTQSLESVSLLHDALQAKGFRVGTITGGQDGEETENVRAAFNADQHRNISELSEQAAARRKAAKYDILICSEAGSAGLNLERGRWMYHYDQPWTAKTLQQREGREDRLTQRWGGIEIHTAKTATPFEERRHQLVRDKADLMNTFMEDTENIDDTGLAADVRSARSEALSGAMMGVAAG